ALCAVFFEGKYRLCERFRVCRRDEHENVLRIPKLADAAAVFCNDGPAHRHRLVNLVRYGTHSFLNRRKKAEHDIRVGNVAGYLFYRNFWYAFDVCETFLTHHAIDFCGFRTVADKPEMNFFISQNFRSLDNVWNSLHRNERAVEMDGKDVAGRR